MSISVKPDYGLDLCYWTGNILKNVTTLYQYSEINVMHFLFHLLRIKGLYMFRELLAHLQVVLH
jgi:hypothetical protein